MPNQDLKYWLGFSRFLKIGPARFKKLYTYFPTLEQAYSASFLELQKAGLEDNLISEWLEFKTHYNLEADWDYLQKNQIEIITILDPAYPPLLKQIHSPPALIYVRGNTETLKYQFNLAVVGTRKFTNYGREAVSQIVAELVQNKIAIVSGLAIGIDALAHEATLNNQGQTIAVLGAGVDDAGIYPRNNFYLAQQIIKNNGAVISEFPPHSTPLKTNFPTRNRIIAGLSLGTLVVEAASRSGALITAFTALEQNREVFAVPGSIFSEMSQGTNMLIKKGAKMVTSASDVLSELNLGPIETFAANQKILPENSEEITIINLLCSGPKHINQIIQETGLTAQAINCNLTLMEMKGLIKNMGGQNYIKL